MSEEAIGCIIPIGAVLALFLVYNGSFYTTGTQYFEACYKKSIDVKEGRIKPELSTNDPYKLLLQDKCDSISQSGIEQAGLTFVPGILSKRTDGLKTKWMVLSKVCPSLYKDYTSPTYIVTMKLFADQDGPSFYDKFLPAETTVSNLYREKWPDCSSEAARLNIDTFTVQDGILNSGGISKGFELAPN
jgi:hypothetical protein